MADPKIADKKPMVMELEPGEYHWCSCGESKTQPWCDGAHTEKGEFEPTRFEIKEKTTSAICMCRHTKNRPFCDGSHAKLG